MLHHILAQVSIHLNRKQLVRQCSAFTWVFCISALSQLSPGLLVPWGFAFTVNFSQASCYQQFQLISFCFMFSLVLGSRADGSRVILSRPHGSAERCGTWQFREVFFRGARQLRTVIRSYLGSFYWYTLQSTNARLYLWFSIQSVTAVTSPRVEQPIADAESSEPSSESET